ncbi:hypothetical protein D3W54_15165 [Komagataeibacter medellinensis]|uniref:Uncharacterized protein n=1 Tax=Komagataeibacter medellinensis TaxID=1177712 RepID=A0ABQ6VRE6_9PROT|nr:hypothetical protein D3W54_15165 [Komagataeibacter medellinensis]
MRVSAVVEENRPRPRLPCPTGRQAGMGRGPCVPLWRDDWHGQPGSGPDGAAGKLRVAQAIGCRAGGAVFMQRAAGIDPRHGLTQNMVVQRKRDRDLYDRPASLRGDSGCLPPARRPGADEWWPVRLLSPRLPCPALRHEWLYGRAVRARTPRCGHTRCARPGSWRCNGTGPRGFGQWRPMCWQGGILRGRGITPGMRHPRHDRTRTRCTGRDAGGHGRHPDRGGQRTGRTGPGGHIPARPDQWPYRG